MIPTDKLLHFAVGVVLFAAFVFFTVPVACTAVIIAAVGKEFHDYLDREHHTPDVWDAVATLLGGGVGLFIRVI